MKEIGGYLELERFTGGEYYPGMVKLNLGRTALLYLMDAADAHTLWVPHFLCEAVTDVCARAGITLKYYSIGRDFLPEPGLRPGPEEYVYLVNYYGRLTPEQILALRGTYGRVILDNTHAFFQGPLADIPALWSLRKFFGLPDGAYVFPGNLAGRLPEYQERDASAGRMGHILGRFEDGGSAHYRTMLDNAHALEQEPVKQMSPLTENLLRGIDYAQVRRTREENYRALDLLLGGGNALNAPAEGAPAAQTGAPAVLGEGAPAAQTGAFAVLPGGAPAIPGPFTYPFLHRDGLRLRKAMAKHGVYVPTYWNNVLNDMPEDSLEYEYAANILPLPCDQRYTPEDMRTVAEVLRQCAEELEADHA